MSDLHQFEPLPEARFKIEYLEGTEWIIVRASRNWFIIPFIGIWLTLWTFGGVAAFSQLILGEAQLFLSLWLIGWAIGWLFAASWLGWQLKGRLRLTVQGQALIYNWSMPLVSKTKRYNAQQVRNLRAGRSMWPWGGGFMNVSYPPFFPMMPGSVQFDYGGRTMNFMPGLDEAEGQLIVDWLSRRLPQGTVTTR